MNVFYVHATKFDIFSHYPLSIYEIHKVLTIVRNHVGEAGDECIYAGENISERREITSKGPFHRGRVQRVPKWIDVNILVCLLDKPQMTLAVLSFLVSASCALQEKMHIASLLKCILNQNLWLL